MHSWRKGSPILRMSNGYLNTYINCKVKMVKSSIDHSSGKDDLDVELLKTFDELGKWEAVKLDGEKVDRMIIWTSATSR